MDPLTNLKFYDYDKKFGCINCGKSSSCLMIFMVSTSLVFVQTQRTITGTIIGTDNNLLPGISIVVKGTTIGTLTDKKGKYSLSVPSDTKILRFNFVVMESKEVEIGNSNVYDVTLAESVVGLEEVVVIGYGKQSREVITTSISKLDNKVLENIPFANVASAWQGNITGLRVQSTSGDYLIRCFHKLCCKTNPEIQYIKERNRLFIKH